MSRELGIGEQQLLDLPYYRESDAYTPLEKLVLELAEHMSRAPVDVPDALLAAMRQNLDEGQLVELVASIAWENYRARFNRVFRVQAIGFSEGAVCALPQPSSSVQRA